MDATPGRELQLAREDLFARLVGAFKHRDFAVFDEAVRPDVVLEMPGSSWLAGTHRGLESFGRHVAGLRQVLRSTDEPTVYLHETDQ
jgi:ketosteroid isomerase-like protein